MENILKSIKEEKSLTLNENELKKLSSYMAVLEEQGADGKKYREALTSSAKKNFAIAIPELSEDCVDEILKGISSENLEILVSSLEKQVSQVIPTSQLYVEEKNENNSNSQFKF